jgi:hypothetical protein
MVILIRELSKGTFPPRSSDTREGAFVLNLNDQHHQLLRLLGRSYEAFNKMSWAVRNVG